MTDAAAPIGTVHPESARLAGSEPPITYIGAANRGRLAYWSEILRYRDLLGFLVWRDVKVLYAQTVMGFGWAIIRPALTMVIFTVVFGTLARVPSDGVPYPLFSYAALVPWTYFATAMTGSTTSLVSNAAMLNKVYFPRLFIPLTPVLAGLVDFAIALCLLFGMMVWYRVAPSPAVLMLPLLTLLMALSAAGVGIWLSALAIQYRDVKHGVPFLAQVLMYAAPVVWPVSLIGHKFPRHVQAIRLVYGLFPMAGVIEGFRSALIHTGPLPWDMLATGTLGAVALTASGMAYFRKKERVFADVA